MAGIRNVVFEATKEKLGLKLVRDPNHPDGDDHCLVKQPAEGSYAARQGIQEGDCVLAVGAGRPGEGPQPEGIVGQSPVWVTERIIEIRGRGEAVTVVVQGEGHEHMLEHFRYQDPTAPKELPKEPVKEAEKSTLPAPTEDPPAMVTGKPLKKEGALRDQCSAFTARTCGLSL